MIKGWVSIQYRVTGRAAKRNDGEMQVEQLFGAFEERQVKGEKRSRAGDDAFGVLASCGADSWLLHECEDRVGVSLEE